MIKSVGFTCLIVFVLNLNLFSQKLEGAITTGILKSYENFVPGKIELDNGKSYECQLYYNSSVPEGLLQVLEGDQKVTVSPNLVKKFSYFDKKLERERVIYSLKVSNQESDYRRLMFFEIIYKNKYISVLNQDTMESLNLNQIGITSMDLRIPVKGTNYYLLDMRDMKIYTKNTSELMEIMGADAKAVKKHMKQTHGSFKSNVDDIIAAIDYYSSLQQ